MTTSTTGTTSAPARGIDFPFTDEQRALRERVRAFAAEKLAPEAERLDTEEHFSHEMHRDLVESGLFGYFVPRELGGEGLSVTSICIIREELARVVPAADELFTSQGIAVQAIALWGSPEQQRDSLAGLMDGSRIFAFGLTEPAAGSDVGGIQSVAVEDGDQFRITGQKRFIYAPDQATHLMVFAKTDPEKGKHGITAFLVEQPESGVRYEDYKLFKPGPETQIHFEDCAVPASSMLGRRGEGIKVALSNLDRLRPSVGAASVGVAESALADSIAYVAQREAFGGRLSDLQAVSHRLANAVAEVDAARMLVYAAAATADGPAVELGASSAKAKLIATETAWRAIDSAAQVHGGSGLRRGSVTERAMKAIRAARIYEGSSEVMQLVVARSLFPRASR